MASSQQEFWEKLYERVGDRCISTRDHGLTPEESGQRDCEIIQSLLGHTHLGRALEIGAGNGRIATWSAAHADELVATELGTNLAKDCAERLSRHAHASVVCCSAEGLADFASGSFDSIYSMYVLQHIPEIEEVTKYLNESARLLRKGGRAVHQVRLRNLRTTTQQLSSGLARTLSKLPTFSKHWRGYRFSPEVLLELTDRYDHGICVRYKASAMHVWIIIDRH